MSLWQVSENKDCVLKDFWAGVVTVHFTELFTQMAVSVFLQSQLHTKGEAFYESSVP